MTQKINLNIIVIDSDPETEQAFKKVKKQTSDSFVFVRSAADARKALGKGKPDIVYSALLESGKDRLSFVSKLAADLRKKEIPLVLLANQEDIALPLNDIGIEGCFYKPLIVDGIPLDLDRIRIAKQLDQEHANDPLYQADKALRRGEYLSLIHI